MALKSMTGYGRGEAVVKGVRAEVELSSVNRKQLDIRIGLPRTMLALESRVQEMIRSAVLRGHITGSVRVIAVPGTRRARVSVDTEAAAQHVKAFRRAAATLGLEDDLTASSLLKFPDVVRYESPAESADDAWPAVKRAMKAAATQLVDMREREGLAVEKDLEKRVAKLEEECGRIEQLAKRVPRKCRDLLRKRLRDLGVDSVQDDSQLAREAALLADRSDISEELTRIRSHLAQAAANIRSAGPVGRALDFLSQEMSREINTVGAKAGDVAISKHVIRFKTVLETIREQVQNVE